MINLKTRFFQLHNTPYKRKLQIIYAFRCLRVSKYDDQDHLKRRLNNLSDDEINEHIA